MVSPLALAAKGLPLTVSDFKKVKELKDAHPHRVTIVAWRKHQEYLATLSPEKRVSPWVRMDCLCWTGKLRRSDNDHRLYVAFRTEAGLAEFKKLWKLEAPKPKHPPKARQLDFPLRAP